MAANAAASAVKQSGAQSTLRQIFGLPTSKVVVAPMVNQSELAFRMLCRKYGAGVCYTPMFHSRIFAENATYRKEIFTTNAEDRPLVVQFCGNDPDIVLEAAKYVEDRCDAVDLNLGCPQQIARRGNYGSFLLENVELLERIVSKLHQNLKVPVTCKIRILPKYEDTIKLCKALEKAGCQLLTVHGRTKEMNKQFVGECDWDVIKKIKQELSIPVFANGGIASLDDLKRCMAETGVDGVMSSEAILENPAAFDPSGAPRPSPVEMTREYLDICDEIGESSNRKEKSIIKAHMFRFLYPILDMHPELREMYGNLRLSERELCDKIDEMHHPETGTCKEPTCTKFTSPGRWYTRYWSGIAPEKLKQVDPEIQRAVETTAKIKIVRREGRKKRKEEEKARKAEYKARKKAQNRAIQLKRQEDAKARREGAKEETSESDAKKRKLEA